MTTAALDANSGAQVSGSVYARPSAEELNAADLLWGNCAEEKADKFISAFSQVFNRSTYISREAAHDQVRADIKGRYGYDVSF
jgi:hypothetical protein